MSELNRETELIPLLNQMLRVFLTLIIAGSMLLGGCSYMPWVGNDDDDFAFEEDFPFEENEQASSGDEDDFFEFVSFLFGSSVSSQSQSNNSSINTADRHIWIPADENELEQRRILQARFDEIEKDIESLFLRLDVLGSDEINMRGGIKKITPDIESMNLTVSGMIKQEESRINNLGQQLDHVKRNNEIFDSDIERLNQTIKLDPVFSSRDYVDAFVSFRKGQYAKSANLFGKALQSNPPYELTDNLLFGLGMSQYRLGNISKVSKPLSRLISEYPDSEKWYMSHLVLALTHYKKREKSQALHVLQKGLKKNPPHFIRSMFMNLNKLIHK